MKMKKTDTELIPRSKNTSPDYFCTWQLQSYARSGGERDIRRAALCQTSLFGDGELEGWAKLYEQARGDMLFVMDDSWDVPPINDGTYYGSLVLRKEKFPSFTAGDVSNAEALKRLSDKMKALGWRGLGGWVAAQRSKSIDTELDEVEYWRRRLIDAERSGFAYWKVDWGERCGEAEFRRMLSKMGREYAPHLVIEQAMLPEVLCDSDVFRTYDVAAVVSIPMTLNKLKSLLCTGVNALLNCEDEPYIAACGGFCMGIMRYPFVGSYPNGKPDKNFPSMGRNIKTKICEVIRGVRWHRVAPAFGVGDRAVYISDTELADSWNFVNYDEEIAAWWLKTPEFINAMSCDTAVMNAPAQITVGCEPLKLKPDENGEVPFVLASQNPSGAYSMGTLGRTIGRRYFIPRCEVEANIGRSELVGVFGEYKSLKLKTGRSGIKRVLMQDIAEDTAYDVTDEVEISDGAVTIDGELIHRIGTLAQPEGDTSEPGVCICLQN